MRPTTVVSTDPEKGEAEAGDPTLTLKIHKAIGFLSNTGPDPMKNHKAIKPAFGIRILSCLKESWTQKLYGSAHDSDNVTTI